MVDLISDDENADEAKTEANTKRGPGNFRSVLCRTFARTHANSKKRTHDNSKKNFKASNCVLKDALKHFQLMDMPSPNEDMTIE